MFICFAEYRIDAKYRKLYLALIEELLAETENVSVLEGTDQADLFVEIWEGESEQIAEGIKKERSDVRSRWAEITAWIVGGPSKLHIWTFKPVPGSRD